MRDLSGFGQQNWVDSIHLADILGWSVLALLLTCIITFACALHERYIRRWREEERSDLRPFVPPPTPYPNPDIKKLVVRGYDSPELLREDLWLLRLNHGRGEVELLKVGVSPLETSRESNPLHPQRVTAMLAQYAGARCDN